mgnify:CR=1 FL=1|tara:strand:- start:186 stop:341 length:156 start_codon:yes stop_codon:yes gene_type:complete
MYNKDINKFKPMDKELIKWLADMPENYKLVGSKQGEYDGEKQTKLFLKKIF